MFNTWWNKLKTEERWLAILAGLALVIGVVARLWNLGYPATQVFDEVYFPVFAQDFLEGKLTFDVHPPLGKLIIALSIALLGDTFVAWRLMPALFGIGFIALMAKLWLSYQGDRIGMWLLIAFLSVETILITYSRTGLVDGILLFFILATFWAASRVRSYKDVWLVAVCLGLAVAIKWLALAVIVPVAFILWRKKRLLQFLSLVWVSYLVYMAVLYTAELLGNSPNPWQAISEWHNQALSYHAYLTATHPWGSAWWSWPIMQRPVLFYYETNAVGRIEMISAMGNPFLWLSSLAAVIGSVGYLLVQIVRRRKIADHPTVPLLLGWAAFFLPWAPIDRVLFLYHYLPSYIFSVLLVVYWLSVAWKRNMALVLLITVLIIGCGLFFLPLATAWPITGEFLKQHIWIKTWL